VLIYGVLGAIVMRAIMILAGAWVVSEFSWVLYLFGAFLLYTGVKMLKAVDEQPDVKNNPVLRFARRHLPVAEGDHGERFLVWKDGKRYVTPLLLVLILIEATDLVFAVDSIPAIFAITSDPFIVFTSNMFAIRACGRCTSCWPISPTVSTCSSMAWPWCCASSASRC
jgi:tellurite resistance protein TerC